MRESRVDVGGGGGGDCDVHCKLQSEKGGERGGAGEGDERMRRHDDLRKEGCFIVQSLSKGLSQGSQGSQGSEPSV